ncbi:MAG: TlpA family protein disulfide reductase, partial [Sphingobacteriales bacterium]
ARQNMMGEWELNNLPVIERAKLNKPAPLLDQVYDMQGKLVDPAMLKGKTIVIDFWATWCIPCIEGFPYMQQVYNRYKDNKDVIFMITNSGSKNSLKDAQDWVAANGFTFPFYYNDRKLAEAFGVNTIPSTFVIDKTGNIQYRTVGFEGPIMEAKLGLQIKSALK